MRHSRRGFTSRVPAPSDVYRRMSATLAAPARAILSRRAARSTLRAATIHANLFHHRQLTPETLTFFYNALISSTKVIKRRYRLCYNVTYNKSANDVWRISGKRNESCDLSRTPCAAFFRRRIFDCEQKKAKVRNHYYLSSTIIDRYYRI